MNCVYNIGESGKCYCDCERCFINKGVFLSGKSECEGLLHKHRCCRACMVKLANAQKKEFNLNEDKEIKIKSQEKTKDTKNGSKRQSDSKKRVEQDKNKDNTIKKSPWNSSTKVTKMDKISEKVPKKKVTKKIKMTTKQGKEEECENREQSCEKEQKNKCVNKEKVENTKGEENCNDKNEGKETIYISYSLKGYLKIKSRKNVEICEQYYTESEKSYDGICECITDITDDCEQETCCGCCEEEDNLNLIKVNQGDEDTCNCMNSCLCIN